MNLLTLHLEEFDYNFFSFSVDYFCKESCLNLDKKLSQKVL